MSRIDRDLEGAAIEDLDTRGVTDGLPVVPPAVEAVCDESFDVHGVSAVSS